ncbi:MAG TPA: type II and III secretion system protein [Candidatus Angelobacter sp.]|jgi:Flp pilus assembly secretin CpaC
MKISFAILSLFFCLACLAAEKPKPAISKADKKAAEKEFKNAQDLQRAGKPEDALLAITKASQFEPQNLEFITMAEVLRQQIVGQHVEEGNRLAAAGDTGGALQRFHIASAMDPQNAYVAQRIHDVAPPDDDPDHKHVLELLASVDQINLQPNPGKKSFHLQGDTRQLYTQIGTAFGIFMQFDQGLNSRVVHFDLDNVDFYTATSIAGKMTKTFWAPISAHEAIVATDSADTRKQYERMALRTFYVGNVSTQTDLNDLVNVMRNIFDMKLVSIQPAKNTITVRAPRESVEAAASLLDNLMDAKPELLLDIKEYEIDTNRLRAMGLDLPTSFQVFSIPSEIRRVLGPDAQSVIDQLNKTGAIDPNSISPSALSNLAGSPLLIPFLFFGKGQGLTGITVPGIKASLSFNASTATNLEHMTLRAIDGEAATFLVGTKFPIINSTFSDVAVSTRGQVQVGSTPQFTYEDLGISLKTTPHYHSNGDVTLGVELKVQALGALQINNIPDITTRSYQGTITVHDGEQSVIMGSLSEQEIRSVQGLPIVSMLPFLGSVLGTNSKERDYSEVLFVITPHVVRKPFRDKGSSVFWNVGP